MTNPLSHAIYGADSPDMFRIQLHDLLEKAQSAAHSRVSKAQEALQELSQIIEQIPPRQGINILKAEESLMQNDNVLIPFPTPRPGNNAKYNVTFDKPEGVDVIQSCTCDTSIGIEIAVTMPSNLFQDKDYLNHRYFYKRAYYLACLAAGIQKSGKSHFSLNFALQNDNPLQPIIVLGPKNDDEENDISTEKWQIRIILVAPECLFPIAKTLPIKCCVRNANTGSDFIGTPLLSTPFYNATIRCECTTISYQKLFDCMSVESQAFKDACILGGVWLRRRGLRSGLASGGFGQFEWTCLVALLLRKDDFKRKPVISRGYSSHQLFKATLQYIATSDLYSKPLVTNAENIGPVDQKGPVFFDRLRSLNILFKMTEWSYNLLRHEAKITVHALKEPLSDHFRYSFVSKIDDPLYRYDYFFSVAVPPQEESTEDADFYNEATHLCRKTYDALSRGLGDRVKLIHLYHRETPSWTLGSLENNSGRKDDVFVGLLFNAEKCWRTVDHGPAAEDRAASQEYREFWGEKAELRRFKDGSILESVVWNGADPSQDILDQIVSYVLRQHKIFIFGSMFNQLLPRHRLDAANPTASFLPITTSLENLEKKIRSLDKLPLQIRHITAASPALRFASFDIPMVDPNLEKMRPADVYVQFEGSTRWPDDIVAIQRTKIAFLLKLGELLEEEATGLTTKLGLENGNKELWNQAFLDIFDPLGTTFRLRIHHERELSILQQSIKSEPSSFRRLELASATSTYKRDFLQRPLHTEMVRKLCTRFPLLSPSMRLMKKWRDSHLLSAHIGDELIELLTIKTFVHPYPWGAPGSIRTGFLRTLAWIASWDWRVEPLTVDLNHDISTQDIEDINLKYNAWRKIDPAMNRVAMFVASRLDPDGVSWTELGPSKVAAARFSNLAVSAGGLAKKQGLNIHAQALFTTSNADYDFIIHLNPRYNSWGQIRKQHTFKNLKLQSDRTGSLAGCNPIQAFVDEITNLHAGNILFFHNAHETTIIAGLWNPQTGLRDWKANMSYSSMPVLDPPGGMRTVINKLATLHDLAILGGNLVSKVEINR